MRDAWKRTSSRFSFLSPDRGGLITRLPFCVLRREPEPRAERLARRADRTRTGPTRTAGDRSRRCLEQRAGTGGSAPPRPYRRPRARSRPLRSYEYEHRDATAQLLPFYKHSNFASARNGRCERRRLRGALLWAPPRITPRIPLVACGTEALAGRLTHLQGPNTPHHASSSSSRSIALLLPR